MTDLQYYCKLNTIDVISSLKKTELTLKNEILFDEDFFRIFKINRKLIFGDLNYKKVAFDVYSEFYKNEFVIKNAFIREKLMNSKAVCSDEYPLLDSRIDLISINGKSIAYEIKTKYDTLKRLNKQLNDYSKCFEFVYVICSDSKLESVLKQIPNYVGVYSYADSTFKNSFVLKREALLSPNISGKSVLMVLNDSEKNKFFKTVNDSEILASYSLEQILFKYRKILKRKFSKKSTLLREESISLID